MTEARVRAPWHLWLVGVVSTLWNLVGAFDYTATELRLEFYINQVPQELLAYVDAFPAWAVAAWAFGVWGALAGSICLLLRSRWAELMFGLSLAGLAVTTLYQYGLTNGLEVMGTGGAIFCAVIWVIAILLLLYARAMRKKGVLA
jgi:hypothetical protein